MSGLLFDNRIDKMQENESRLELQSKRQMLSSTQSQEKTPSRVIFCHLLNEGTALKQVALFIRLSLVIQISYF